MFTFMECGQGSSAPPQPYSPAPAGGSEWDSAANLKQFLGELFTFTGANAWQKNYHNQRRQEVTNRRQPPRHPTQPPRHPPPPSTSATRPIACSNKVQIKTRESPGHFVKDLKVEPTCHALIANKDPLGLTRDKNNPYYVFDISESNKKLLQSMGLDKPSDKGREITSNPEPSSVARQPVDHVQTKSSGVFDPSGKPTGSDGTRSVVDKPTLGVNKSHGENKSAIQKAEPCKRASLDNRHLKSIDDARNQESQIISDVISAKQRSGVTTTASRSGQTYPTVSVPNRLPASTTTIITHQPPPVPKPVTDTNHGVSLDDLFDSSLEPNPLKLDILDFDDLLGSFLTDDRVPTPKPISANKASDDVASIPKTELSSGLNLATTDFDDLFGSFSPDEREPTPTPTISANPTNDDVTSIPNMDSSPSTRSPNISSSTSMNLYNASSVEGEVGTTYTSPSFDSGYDVTPTISDEDLFKILDKAASDASAYFYSLPHHGDTKQENNLEIPVTKKCQQETPLLIQSPLATSQPVSTGTELVTAAPQPHPEPSSSSRPTPTPPPHPQPSSSSRPTPTPPPHPQPSSSSRPTSINKSQERIRTGPRGDNRPLSWEDNFKNSIMGCRTLVRPPRRKAAGEDFTKHLTPAVTTKTPSPTPSKSDKPVSESKSDVSKKNLLQKLTTFASVSKPPLPLSPIKEVTSQMSSQKTKQSEPKKDNSHKKKISKQSTSRGDKRQTDDHSTQRTTTHDTKTAKDSKPDPSHTKDKTHKAKSGRQKKNRTSQTGSVRTNSLPAQEQPASSVGFDLDVSKADIIQLLQTFTTVIKPSLLLSPLYEGRSPTQPSKDNQAKGGNDKHRKRTTAQSTPREKTHEINCAPKKPRLDSSNSHVERKEGKKSKDKKRSKGRKSSKEKQPRKSLECERTQREGEMAVWERTAKNKDASEVKKPVNAPLRPISDKPADILLPFDHVSTIQDWANQESPFGGNMYDSVKNRRRKCVSQREAPTPTTTTTTGSEKPKRRNKPSASNMSKVKDTPKSVTSDKPLVDGPAITSDSRKDKPADLVLNRKSSDIPFNDNSDVNKPNHTQSPTPKLAHEDSLAIHNQPWERHSSLKDVHTISKESDIVQLDIKTKKNIWKIKNFIKREDKMDSSSKKSKSGEISKHKSHKSTETSRDHDGNRKRKVGDVSDLGDLFADKDLKHQKLSASYDFNDTRHSHNTHTNTTQSRKKDKRESEKPPKTVLEKKEEKHQSKDTHKHEPHIKTSAKISNKESYNNYDQKKNRGNISSVESTAPNNYPGNSRSNGKVTPDRTPKFSNWNPDKPNISLRGGLATSEKFKNSFKSFKIPKKSKDVL